MDPSVGVVTVSVASPVQLPMVAVMFDVPASRVVASPVGAMVAARIVPEDQAVSEVMFWTVPSE